jgi:hypothetical protein
LAINPETNGPEERSARASATRLLLWAAVVCGIVGYFLWVVRDPVILGFLALAVAALVANALAVALVVGTVSLVVWRFLPSAARDFHRRHRTRFVAIIVFCLVCFAALGFVINRQWLPGRLHPISLTVDAWIAVYVAVLGWTLMGPSRRRLLVVLPASAVFVVVATILVVVAPHAPARDKGSNTDQLTSLGYLTWVPVKDGGERSGVVFGDSTKAYPGINLYGPRSSPRAFLMEMDGTILHTWARTNEPDDNWGHFELYPNGDLLVQVGESSLMCLDWASNIKWIRRIRCHHDMAIAPDGDIYVLTREPRIVRCHGFPTPILDDKITILGPDGVTKRVISMFDAIGEIVPASRVRRIYRTLLDPRAIRWFFLTNAESGHVFEASTAVDVFHTNTIEFIEEDFDDVFRRGNLLLCSRTQNTVAVFDPAAEKLVWTWGRDELEWPHHPNVLDNGNILIFDNGSHRKYSRIVELDPRALRIVWEYTAERREDFFSYTRGGDQRLPNGNTLITNSDSGHVFEVTPDGEIVWEFLTPELDKSGARRSAVYRMVRIVEPEEYPCLLRVTTRGG